jgi:hypothetical protein
MLGAVEEGDEHGIYPLPLRQRQESGHSATGARESREMRFDEVGIRFVAPTS